MKRILIALLLPIILMGCSTRYRPGQGINSNPGITTYPENAPMNVTLSSFHWQLTDAKNAQGAPIVALLEKTNQPIQLDFVDDRYTVSNTCNNMTGQYSTNVTQITFGTAASTRRLCVDERLANLDDEVANRLLGTMTYRIQRTPDPYLILTNSAGDVLTFRGTKTAEMAYGSTGETIYLEVAPQMQPCNHPLMPGKECLQVRQVYYDNNGLRVGSPDAWEVLGQDIQGYNFQPGIANVIRVKRYNVTNPPADGSSKAYVLDAVIETRLP